MAKRLTHAIAAVYLTTRTAGSSGRKEAKGSAKLFAAQGEEATIADRQAAGLYKINGMTYEADA